MPVVDGVAIEAIPIPLKDPTHHRAIYEALTRALPPRLRAVDELHVNVSPGTPAMHAVWIVLQAGGLFPAGTRLWSSQKTKDAPPWITAVDFEVTTYLAEVRRQAAGDPVRVAPDPALAHSLARRDAYDRLRRFSAVRGAPLLVLGERGTGKSLAVETLVAPIKVVRRSRAPCVTVACGALDLALAESTLFGHVRGAFTGAIKDRPGALTEASGRVLFLDEVQDLPPPVQRKLVRTFQGGPRRYRPVGADEERETDAELVCASNLTLDGLRAHLDEDLLDRLSVLTVRLPPLRECREDLAEDWGRVWRAIVPETDPPMDQAILKALETDPLRGNFRDLERMAHLLLAWRDERDGVRLAIAAWNASNGQSHACASPVAGTRKERLKDFLKEQAVAAHRRHGTWSAAANALGCDERTLRDDAADGV